MAFMISNGKTVRWLNNTGSDVISGQAVLVGDKLLVAEINIPNGEEGVLNTEGVFPLPKAAEGIGLCANVYWNSTNGNLTTTATDNTYAGFACKAAIGADTTVAVKING